MSIRPPPFHGPLLLAGLLCLAGSPAEAQTTHAVDIVGTSFSPSQITIQAGDSVRWTNRSGGAHNVAADDNSFRNGNPSSSVWTFTRGFNTPGEFGYYCQPHGSPGGIGMSGKVIVQGEAPPPPNDFVINEGISGSWYNPATVGQGVLLEASAELGVVAFAWFTWTAEGGYDWLTGVGPYEGHTAVLDVYRSQGGRFNDGAFAVEGIIRGEAVLTFTDCSNGTFSWDVETLPGTGTVPLVRTLPPSPACVELNGAPGAER